jgi:hypothetical protein
MKSSIKKNKATKKAYKGLKVKVDKFVASFYAEWY